METIYNLRSKTVLYLICNRSKTNGSVGMSNGKAEQRV